MMFSIDGVVSFQVIRERLTKEITVVFIGQTLETLARRNKDAPVGYTIYLDNAGMNKSKEVVNLRKKFNVNFMYGIVGKSHLNSVEHAFCELKRFMKKRRTIKKKDLLEEFTSKLGYMKKISGWSAVRRTFREFIEVKFL